MGERQIYPMAWITVNCPYFKGRTKGTIFPMPRADLIIGKIERVCKHDHKDIERWKIENEWQSGAVDGVT